MRYLAFIFSLPLLAATTVQPVTEISAQQAILRYQTTVDPSMACEWAIAETISGATPDDVNTSIFLGANLDTRAGSLITGQNRAFVFGQRTSAAGLDHLLHSRSAKAMTRYTATVRCGADSPVTVYFSTGNIELGETYSEQPPFSTSGFGNWAWPTIDWSNQATQYTDPMTGVVIQRVSSPGWFGVQQAMTKLDFAIGGSGWTNPTNILNGSTCAGTSTTCAESSNSNSIFLSINGRNLSPIYSPVWFSAGFTPYITYDDFLLALTGTAGSGAQNVSVCLSYYDSGATCNSGTQVITLSGSVSTAGFPAAGSGVAAGSPQWSPQFQLGEWGGTLPRKTDFAFAFGCPSSCPDLGYGANHYAGAGVTTSGAAVAVNCSSGSNSESCFDIRWNNSYIYIQGSGCIDGGTDICQVSGHPADTEHLTLKNAPATACSSPCNWASLAAGFVVTPNGAGTVDIGAQYSFAYSPLFQLSAEGDTLHCNPVPVSVGYQADGSTPINQPVSGELCFIAFQTSSNIGQSGGALFLLIPSTGEVRFISPLYAPAGADSGDAAGDRNSAQIVFSINAWDSTSGLCVYGLAQTQTTGKYSIYQGCYNPANNWKAYSHPLWPPSGFAAGQNPATGNRWSDDPMTYTNISPPSRNLDIYTQMAANNPQFDTRVFPFCTLDRIVGGYAFVACTSGQDTFAVVSSFNLVTGNNVGNGDTFSRYPARFGGDHSSFSSNAPPGNYALAINPPGAAGAYTNPNATGIGPHQITPYSMLKSFAFSTDTSMTTSLPLDACPTNPFGIIGNMCVTFHTQDVCSHSPGANEKAKWPCPYNPSWSQITPLAAGDGLTLPGNENLQIVSSTPVTDPGCGTDCVAIVAGRAQFGSPLTAVSAGWTGYAIPPGRACNYANCGLGTGLWIPASASGQYNWLLDPLAFGAHVDAGAAPTAGNFTLVTSACVSTFLPYCAHHSRYNLPLSGQVLISVLTDFSVTKNMSATAPFAGVLAQGMNQSYPSNEQINAVNAAEKNWFLDYMAINPGVGVGPESVVPSDAVTYSLVNGTNTIYLFTGITGQIAANEANYKLFGLIGNAGRYLLQDVSGPSSSLSDSAQFQVCMALAAGECRSGSSAGNVYAAVPNVPSVQPACITGWLTENFPCVGFRPPLLSWLVQMDASRSYSGFEFGRRLTLGLTGHLRQYGYSTFIPEPTGTWGLFKADWADGVRSEIFMAKLPPFPTSDSAVPLNTFINYAVPVPGGANYAEIEFGYMENGAANAYYCTSRQDTCTTSGSPFAFPSIDTRSLTSCSSGCTINIPVISGRAVYYSIGTSSDGASWTYGAQQVFLSRVEQRNGTTRR